MHLPSYLLSFPVPAPCPGSHGRGSWSSSWSSAAVMRVCEIQYEIQKVWQKTCHFFLFPLHSCLTLPLLHLPVHRVLSKGFIKLQEGLSMIHRCAELGHVWPVQLLGSESIGAVFVRADPSPPIPHGKQGQQQQLYRIKVLVLHPVCVSCPLLFLQPDVHKSLRRLAGVSPLSWKWRTIILPLTLNDLILCKTELLAKPLVSSQSTYCISSSWKPEIWAVFCGLCPLVRALFLFHPMSGDAGWWTEVYLFINKLVHENQSSGLEIASSFLIFTKIANFLMES